jgi:hypothetical protein
LRSNAKYTGRIIRWMKRVHTYTVNLDALPDLAKCEGHSTLQRAQHTILGNRRPNVHRAMFEPFALLPVVERGGSRDERYTSSLNISCQSK